MNTLQLVLAALGAVLDSAAIKGGEEVRRALALVLALAKEGETAHGELQSLALEIEDLDAQGGGVPPEVWDAWEARHEAAHARLQALKPSEEGQ